jgi:hypothetical protein
MPRTYTHYMVDAFQQKDARSPASLIESARVVASGDEAAVREAEAVRLHLKPAFIVVREVSWKGNRIIHRSPPVFTEA